jgi:hypothetical protein
VAEVIALSLGGWLMDDDGSGPKRRLKTVKPPSRAMARSHYTQWRNGDLRIEHWTSEELAKRAPDGAPPGFVMTLSEDAIARRELSRRVQVRYEALWLESIKQLRDIMMYADKDSDRLRAIELITERAAGRTAQRVDLSGADSWSEMLGDVIGDRAVLVDVDVEEFGT